MRVADLESIRIKLASPEEILSWSHGEVTKPETINYRTQKPEKDGLFCERIFGPSKDYECHCGKYRKIRYKGIICDKCGVEITKSSVRRERMGHIQLAVPCAHIWFLRGIPSRMGQFLNIPASKLESVIYFVSYIITKINKEAKKKILKEIKEEYEAKVKVSKSDKSDKSNKIKINKELTELKEAMDKAKEEVMGLKPLTILSELEYQNFSLKYGEIFEAGTGAEALRNIFKGINFKEEIVRLKKEANNTSESLARRKILRRLKMIEKMFEARIKPEWMFLTVLPILPPDLRPMVQLDGGRYASSDLNDLYRRVINRNNRLKYLLEIDAPDVIVRNEKRMLQEAVDALIDNNMRKGQTTMATTGGKRLLKSLADMLKGKQGRFRQNLLGKRVDYSGRSVIVVGPELQIFQCGLPKKMALELFKPFVLKKIIDKELAYNVRGASRLVEEKTAEVWAILEDVVKNKFVLLNRAPTLHRLGVQAFQPILVEGDVIRLHPLVCKAFNADFDGDQMAVHVPLSNEAQKECAEIMSSQFNLLKPANGLPVVTPTQDIILGVYFLTRLDQDALGKGKIFSSIEEAKLAYEFGYIGLGAKIKVRLKGISPELLETSVGRTIFNEALPRDYPFINYGVNSKKLEKIISEIIEIKETNQVIECLDKIKNLGFEYSTFSGVTWGMDDLIVPPEKEKIIQNAEKEVAMTDEYHKKGLLSSEERVSKIIEIWQRAKLAIGKLVPNTLSHFGSVFSIIASGARGSWSQPVQMSGIKGLVINPAGQIIELPIKSSYKEGFNVLEFFISTHGARKGATDTALRTSTAGYLTRRLVDVAHEVVVNESDCRDEKGMVIFRKDADEIGQDFVFKILGRTALEDINKSSRTGRTSRIVKKGEIIDQQKAKQIIEAGIERVRVRSPLTCRSVNGVCRKCYGWSLGNNKLVNLGEAVGIIAAQAIGEPGTQLTMRTFHTGGVASGGDITQGLPRVQEVFECRQSGSKAVLSLADGKVKEITDDRIIKIESNPTATLPRVQQNSKSKTKKKIKKEKKEEIVEYKISGKKPIWVEKGKKVSKGEQLCEGNIDIRELFKITDLEQTQRYIVKEIQKIYNSQGAVIHDKHIEVIIKQMFSRVKIKEENDSCFTRGEIREKAKVIQINDELRKGAKPAVYQSVLLGISEVALTTESFLSAASFQETSRVLIRAAIEGKEDHLRGLKENVMLGKLIPAGTGFRK